MLLHRQHGFKIGMRFGVNVRTAGCGCGVHGGNVPWWRFSECGK
jgi:hypothetical protein